MKAGEKLDEEEKLGEGEELDEEERLDEGEDLDEQEKLDEGEELDLTRTDYSPPPTCFWKDEALFKATTQDWAEAIDLLVDHGANIHARATNQVRYFRNAFYEDFNTRPQTMHATTLQIAVQSSRLATVEKLLGILGLPLTECLESTIPASSMNEDSSRSMVNAEDDVGRIALHYLVDRDAKLGADSEAIMQMSIAHGANIMAQSREGVIALHVAASIGSLTEFTSFMEQHYTSWVPQKEPLPYLTKISKRRQRK